MLQAYATMSTSVVKNRRVKSTAANAVESVEDPEVIGAEASATESKVKSVTRTKPLPRPMCAPYYPAHPEIPFKDRVPQGMCKCASFVTNALVDVVLHA